MKKKIKNIIKNSKNIYDKKPIVRNTVKIVIATFFVLSLNTLSYAYFNADVEGEGKEMVMTTSDMRIAFTDTESINEKGMIPGDTITKTFTVTNESASSVDYKINWEYLINNFVNKQYLVYTVTSTNSGGSLTQTQVPDSEEHINIINNITIASGVTQEYTLTVTYLDSGSAQDEDRNKSLIGKLEVTDLDGNSILPETSTGPSSSSVPLDRNLYGLTVRNLMNEMYPVGSIYISTSSDNPAAKFGGEWMPYGEGRTIMGVGSIKANTSTTEGSVTAGEINKTSSEVRGGEKNHKLILTEIPSHSHTMGSRGGYTYSGGSAAAIGDGYNLNSNNYRTAYSGGGSAHNNIQPYITVYMWKRTA